MRSFAIALLAAVAAATGDYDYGYGEGEISTVVLTSTDVQTITSCAGGCSAHPTPVSPSVEVPVVHPTSAPVASSVVAPLPIPETCLPNTVTVTVTVPGVPATSAVVVPPVVPTSAPVANPPFPSGSSSAVKPTGTGFLPTGIVTPTPSPPAFTGAASQAQIGGFVAGVGAMAAFFL